MRHVGWNRSWARALTCVSLGSLLAGACYRPAAPAPRREVTEATKAAEALESQGDKALGTDDFVAAEDLFRQALAIRETLAPDGLEVAALLSSLGSAVSGRGDLIAAEGPYRRALAILEKRAPESVDLAMTLNDFGAVAAERGDLAAAETLQRRALAILEKKAPDSLQMAMTLGNLGGLAADRDELTAAEALTQKALAIVEKVMPGVPLAGTTLAKLGNVALKRGELAAAEDLFKKALQLEEELSPGSLDVASILNNLGVVASHRGDLAAAEEFYKKALAIYEKLAPGGLSVAHALGNLGTLAHARGDEVAAEDFFRGSLEITERFAPESLDVAGLLNNLGVIAYARGDLIAAEEFHKRSLAIKEKLAPDSLDLSTSLNNLGDVVFFRGDVATAEDLYRRALAIRERLAPESLVLASSLDLRARVAAARGDLAAAENLHKRVLTIRERLAPGSLDVAETLHMLGGMAARARRDFVTAEDLLKKSLAIRERLAPGSMAFAGSLWSLGMLSAVRGDLPAAEGLITRCLAIVERVRPGSLSHANVLRALGQFRLKDRTLEAVDYFRRAIEALESQKAKLGGSEELRSGFEAQTADFYRDYIKLLRALGQITDAFHILERSRARALLAMLAERDLLVSELPPDLAQERKRVDREYDQVQSALGKLDSVKEAAEIDRLLGRLRELRDKREEMVSKIRKASPHFAALQYPQPLDLAGVRAVLDPGTVLLSYFVDHSATALFVIEPASSRGNGLSVLTLPIGERALQEKVESFRKLIQRRDPGGSALLADRGAELYEALVRPAESLIVSYDRVLISPEGPLHTLPFAALVRKDGRSPTRYFVEWKPIHTVVSATIYAELKRSRREGGTPSLALTAFGDPHYPALSGDKAESIRDRDVRGLILRGYRLDPLPASRAEVDGIAGLYAPDATRYLGDEATEERAKSISKDVRYIHFACHGLLDEASPLNSALALTIPDSPGAGQDNGLLQAWEIFEHVRIDADLVTLSACDTALGKEMGGEGLVGLTRAFQYAGARSILASLWSVSDQSTADLMKRFYTYLKEGKTKDQALRAAQMDLMRTRSASHPFHWAAFQLIGDWK